MTLSPEDTAMTESASKKSEKAADQLAGELQAQRVPQGLATASSQAATPREVVNTASKDAEKVDDTYLKPGKASGAQLEPAAMTPQGAVPHNVIATGSGWMPAGIVARDTDEANAMGALTRAESKRRLVRGSHSLTAEELLAMRPAEIRAVAADRGYDIGAGGIRVTIQKFLKAQEEDQLLESEDKETEKLLAPARKEVEAADELRAQTAHVPPANVGGIQTGVPAVTDPRILHTPEGEKRKTGLGTDKPSGK